MKPQAAVLTGDLIGSTAAAPEAIETAMKKIGKIADGMVGKFARYRGDGWQIHLPDAGLGLCALLKIAAMLRADGLPDSRIALGLGQASNVQDDLANAGGSAFIHSGRLLDAMDPKQRFDLGGTETDLLHRRLILMIDHETRNWSPEQAEVVREMLVRGNIRRPPQQMIARRLGITRQAVAARLQAAGFAQLDGAQRDFYKQFHPGASDD